jgi:hypothetical protein
MKRLEPEDERWIDDARRAAHVRGPPPTIADCKAEGCIGFHVCCNGTLPSGRRCGNWKVILWEDVNLPPELPFPQIAHSIRARCTKCGCQRFHIVPDATHQKRPGPL